MAQTPPSQREDMKNKCILYEPHTVSSRCHGRSWGYTDLEVAALLRPLLSHSCAFHREAGCRAAIVGGPADVRWTNILLTCKDAQGCCYLQHLIYLVIALVPSSEGGTRPGRPQPDTSTHVAQTRSVSLSVCRVPCGFLC